LCSVGDSGLDGLIRSCFFGNVTFFIDALIQPATLLGRRSALSKPSPISAMPGVYAWYFEKVPPGVPVEGCVVKDGRTLLYAGISPSRAKSSQNLRKRITYHFRGNAEGSTLRLTLGVLLAAESGFPLRRVGSGRRLTFTHLGEQWLDDWMEQNAHVCWIEHPEPWRVESELFGSVSLPLNIQDNRHHPFSSQLSELRAAAKREAKELPIANEGNQQRIMQA
jgi:hypothetical protein